MDVNGCNLFGSEKFNNTSLFHTHFYVRCHFGRLLCCRYLSHDNQTNSTLAGRFNLYYNTTNIQLGRYRFIQKIGAIIYGASFVLYRIQKWRTCLKYSNMACGEGFRCYSILVDNTKLNLQSQNNPVKSKQNLKRVRLLRLSAARRICLDSFSKAFRPEGKGRRRLVDRHCWRSVTWSTHHTEQIEKKKKHMT
jgi:hypothetical protein